MLKSVIAVGAVASALAMAGCGNTGHPAASPTATHGAGQAPSGAGPFRIQALYCGPFTASVQRRYPTVDLSINMGIRDNGGLIFRYTSVSGSAADRPVLKVDFLRGSLVVGYNVNADDIPPISRGESAVGEVETPGGKFASCKMLSYTDENTGGGPFAL